MPVSHLCPCLLHTSKSLYTFFLGGVVWQHSSDVLLLFKFLFLGNHERFLNRQWVKAVLMETVKFLDLYSEPSTGELGFIFQSAPKQFSDSLLHSGV